MGNSCWGLKDDPFIDSNRFLVIILLDGNISSEEQETVWGDFCAVVQVYLQRELKQVYTLKSLNDCHINLVIYHQYQFISINPIKIGIILLV